MDTQFLFYGWYFFVSYLRMMPKPVLWNFLLHFLLKMKIVLALFFMSFVCIKLISVHTVVYTIQDHFLLLDISASSLKYLFPYWISWHLCQKSIDLLYGGLFLSFCSVPWNYLSIFATIPWCFYYCSFILSWNQIMSSNLILFSTLFFSILGSVHFYINFRIVFSVSLKILLGFCSILHRIYSHFENDWHLSNTGVPLNHEHVLPFLPPCHVLDISWVRWCSFHCIDFHIFH